MHWNLARLLSTREQASASIASKAAPPELSLCRRVRRLSGRREEDENLFGYKGDPSWAWGWAGGDPSLAGWPWETLEPQPHRAAAAGNII